MRHSNSALMICPQFHPVVGGYERAAQRLSRALACRGVRIAVATFRLQANWLPRETIDGFDVFRLWCIPNRWLSTITTILSLSVFLLTHGRRYDVWHCHAPTAAAATAIAWAKLLQKPIIVKLPSSGHSGLRQALHAGVLGRLGLMRALLLQASVIIVMTETVRAEVLQLGFATDRIHFLPNGVDTSLFKPLSASDRAAVRKRLGISDGIVLALQVCRIDVEKNLPRLLEAWASLPPTIAAIAKLAIVGDGPLMPAIRAQVSALNLRDAVILPGKCDDVEGWYQAADLYILSSFHEGLSNSLLEAMASGLPVVMTDVSGKELVLEQPAAGVIVPVDDAPALSKAIAALLDDVSARQEMRTNARQRILEGFGIDSVAERTLHLYEKLSEPHNHAKSERNR